MSKNLETRLERLERVTVPVTERAPTEIHVYGVGRDENGELVEDAEPGIIVHIAPTRADDAVTRWAQA